jgi:hypothetical protein
VKEMFRYKIHHFLRPDPPYLLLDGSIGRIARERSGGRIGSFSRSTSSTMVLDAHISIGWGVKNRPVGGRTSETSSHPIIMIMIMIILMQYVEDTAYYSFPVFAMQPFSRNKGEADTYLFILLNDALPVTQSIQRRMKG